ncbi:ATP-dependent DNA helicase [Natronoglycomyces albus]|uniref:ATP-dependent DNA helicase n=2 Tax=Natronoglycomyces albus TaxID=2811108 RepID=A0A895XPK9_9ACTN|nr:ATP-dependent DNA helicase [Natronoglycomyces albus]
MTEAVADAITNERHLLVQAGTGTGKSLAYLCAALASGRTVVVSTATLALQHQLVTVDLPRLVEAVQPVMGRRPTFALLKGRHHYVCRHKMSVDEEDGEAEALPEMSKQRFTGGNSYAAQVARLYDWANDTDTGDRDDLDPGVSDWAWRQVSVNSRECVGASNCGQGADCFAETAKQRAHAADIIVTNHALLSIDMMKGREILPQHSVVIVDEAHELADRVTSAAAADLSPAQLTWLAQRSRKKLGVDISEKFQDASRALADALDATGTERLVELPAPVSAALGLIDSACAEATTILAGSGEKDKGDLAAAQLREAMTAARETAGRLQSPGPTDVVWKDSNPRNPQLSVAPFAVAGLLTEQLYPDRVVVATSATLTLGGTFDTVARSLGLDPARHAADEDVLDYDTLDVGSPFNYPKQGILYVASHLPRPRASGLADDAAKELRRLVEAIGGRTLGLFSSRKAAESAADLLREHTDLPILLQGEETLAALVKRFRSEPQTCLLGVMSLWQGVDVPGDACQLVVIDRIPFPRPNEPLTAARNDAAEAAGKSGFAEVSVPHAAVRLAQGAGRLIRRVDDKGVVAILDSRLHTARSYGPFLRRSLPELWYTTDADKVAGALGRLGANPVS